MAFLSIFLRDRTEPFPGEKLVHQGAVHKRSHIASGYYSIRGKMCDLSKVRTCIDWEASNRVGEHQLLLSIYTEQGQLRDVVGRMGLR